MERQCWHRTSGCSTCGNDNFYAYSGYCKYVGGASGIWNLYTAGGTTPIPDTFTPLAVGTFTITRCIHRSESPISSVNSLLDVYGYCSPKAMGTTESLGNADGTYNLGGNHWWVSDFNVNIGFGGTPNNHHYASAGNQSTIIWRPWGC